MTTTEVVSIRSSRFMVSCCIPYASRTVKAQLRAAWLHRHHVLGARQRQLQQFEDGFAHALDGVDAGGERQQEDVDPGDEEGDRPADEPQRQEPQKAPQQPRAPLGHCVAVLMMSRVSAAGGDCLLLCNIF